MTALALNPGALASLTAWETSQFAARGPAAACSTHEGVSARAAYQLVLFGRAVLVDIRPEAQRRAEGEVASVLGPVVVEPTVLERRLDPRGDARLPWVTEQTQVLLLCQEGYASSLAAASLVRLGVRATDVVGGLRAWREAGLPLASGPVRAGGRVVSPT